MNGRRTGPTTEIARRAVFDWLRETDPGACGQHFRHPNTWETAAEGAPLASTRAASELGRAMQRLVIEHALRARGAGESWDDVARALAVESDGRPDAAAAYLTTLGVRTDDPWWSPARGVAWTCEVCEQVVRDYGPDMGSPEDREDGHAHSCSRHAADMLAWEALWA
jgi:hypothetical protein